MRAAAWAIGAPAVLVGAVYLLLVIVNWNDEPRSADAERIIAMGRDRPALADAENGYIHALGLAAASDADPLAMGRARSAYIAGFVAPPAGEESPGLPGEDADYRAARSEAVAELAAACSEAAACADAFDAHGDATVQWLTSEQWLLERYRRMLATGGWREAIPDDIATPLPGYQHAMEAQKLHLLDARRLARAQDTHAVRGLLERDIVFWRRVLASSDMLITKMIAAAAVRRNFVHGNLALRELPPELADAAVPPSWRNPLTVAERSLARSLGGEWHYTDSAVRKVSAEAHLAAVGDGRTGPLARSLFQPQATSNLFAARMVQLGALSERPYAELAPVLDELAAGPGDARPWLRPYNPIGHVLAAIAPPAYVDYIARTADLEGQRRAALLLAGMRSAGIGREGAAAAVREAALRNPLDDAPFEWDATGGKLVFQGLQGGERGRYALVF